MINFILEALSQGRFHQQLRDTFAPLVVRYVDLMESCIAQSIHKGFEKENWKLITYKFSIDYFSRKSKNSSFSISVMDVQQVKIYYGSLMLYKILFGI
jgi:hypothetical protein